MTDIDHTERYTAGQALYHPWITRKKEDSIPLTLNEIAHCFEKEQKMSSVRNIKNKEN